MCANNSIPLYFYGLCVICSPPEGSFVRRRRYTGDQLVITLPQGTNACDIGELTIWCRPFNAYFTAITFNHGTLFVSVGIP